MSPKRSQDAQNMQGMASATPRKRGRKPVDPNESKAVRFKRLAGSRMAIALKVLKGLEACSNAAVYEYTDAQVQKMVQALENATNRIRKAYAQGSPTSNGSRSNFFD